MILIDTNVISEPLRAAPEPRVAEWLDAQSIQTLYLAAISVAELRFGVAAMPAGKRQTRLSENLETRLLPLFIGRVLPFDLAASHCYARLMAKARTQGLAIGVADGLIAATASANHMAVATRDTAPFRAAGIEVINPWEPR